MESLDFLYVLKDVEGFDGRPVPPPEPSPPKARRKVPWWELSVVGALVILFFSLFSIGREIRRERSTRTIAARN